MEKEAQKLRIAPPRSSGIGQVLRGQRIGQIEPVDAFLRIAEKLHSLIKKHDRPRTRLPDDGHRAILAKMLRDKEAFNDTTR